MVKNFKDFKKLVHLLKNNRVYINGVIANDEDKFDLCKKIFLLKDNIKKLVQYNNLISIETID